MFECRSDTVEAKSGVIFCTIQLFQPPTFEIDFPLMNTDAQRDGERL